MENLNKSILEPINYEVRLVCFFDILGWKSHIDKAGTDPTQLTRLAFLPRILSSGFVKSLSTGSNNKVTSFSDCAVLSIPYDENEVAKFVQGLCSIFVGGAINGFFVRAGVTVGNLYHDDQLVFGPALNKAYFLESTGKYPRIILDRDIEEFQHLSGVNVRDEEGTLFIDPFSISTFRKSCENTVYPLPEKMDGMALYVATEELVRREMEGASSEHVKNKFEWLYKRMRHELKHNLFK
ncbi:hypothetical protein J2W43_001230 [Pseudomonas brassicacearum]|uniref:Guanylate cyclase domain-containing protein n=1 Tax=Pseudomonas brassicacearum TaxID=930166 RepID=A0AAW8M740_9PSED|nr:hypothetical protein [Pseudomonas brassicacearum]MDR6957254.1 hypothetical protein [Pseudomonas brassicacearum]